LKIGPLRRKPAAHSGLKKSRAQNVEKIQKKSKNSKNNNFNFQKILNKIPKNSTKFKKKSNFS
jgi:hypothetical protein